MSDSPTYLPKVHTVPQTNMTLEESSELVSLLHRMPSNTGFMISHMIEPPHTPGIFGGFHAIVMLPTGGKGEADGNNPCIALRTAWARAHIALADILMPKDKP